MTRRKFIGTGIAGIASGALGFPTRGSLGAREQQYEMSNRLPYDSEVEWIRSDGEAYIDTRIPWDTTLTFDCEWEQFSKQGFVAILGARDVNSGGAGYQITGAPTTTGGVYYYQVDLGGLRTNTGLLGNPGHFRCVYNGNSISIRRDSVGNTISVSPPIRQGSRNILIFASDNAGRILPVANIGFRHIVFSDVLDLVSVRITNEYGFSEGAMYDRITGELFRNAGSGAFIIGPDV